MNVSFDFDITLCKKDIHPETEYVLSSTLNPNIKSYLDSHSVDEIYIVSSRVDNKNNMDEIVLFCNEHNITPKSIHLTNIKWKYKTLIDLNIDVHYDDDESELEFLGKESFGTENIKGVLIQ
jgi:D-arabinose 1-dehydrogenase-like Zn-dependent alcohol dehydrogenase